MIITPSYIQEGTYTGGGFYFLGLRKHNSSPFDCSFDIELTREAFLVSGFYQYPSTVDRHKFSASLGEQCISDLRSVKTPIIGSFDLNDDPGI